MEITSNNVNFKYKIKDVIPFLYREMRIRCNGDGNGVLPKEKCVEGIVGEIDGEHLIIFNNQIEGRIHLKQPEEKGYRYGWMVNLYNEYAFIQFLDEKGNVIPLSSKCVCCNNYKEVNINNFKIKDEFICEECIKKFYVKCIRCKVFIHKRNIRKDINNNLFCKKCYEMTYTYCAGCDKEERRELTYRGLDNKLYCQECWGLRFGYCEVCNNVKYLEELRRNEEFEIYYCNLCSPQPKAIKNYSFRPIQWGFKKMKWEEPLFVGIELEVEPFSQENIQNTAHSFRKFLKSEYMENMFYFKYDSSISGFEIVSHPFTLQYAHTNLKFKKIMDWLIENGYSSYKSGRCGFHVHIDRRSISNLNVSKLRGFFSKCNGQIYAFSKRDGTGLDYCIYESFNKEYFLKHVQNGRHSSININTGKNTVEIRVFRGTLNYNRFISSLQFCYAIVEFVKQSGSGIFLRETKKHEEEGQKLWDSFIDWSKKQERYSHFIKYNAKKEGREI